MPFPSETSARRPFVIGISALVGLAFAIIMLGFRPTADAMLTEAVFRQGRDPPITERSGRMDVLSSQSAATNLSLDHAR
jgi:hypothetical protein